MNVWYKKGAMLQEEIRQTHLPDFLLAMWYIGQMGLVVKWKETTVCFDPVLNDLRNPDGTSRRNYEPPFPPETWREPEYVIGTHGHADHINLETLLPMAKANPSVKFIVPQPELQRLTEGGIGEHQVIGAKAGEAILLKPGMVLHPVAAAHETYETDPDGNFWNLGYVLECGKNRLYHAGDTVLTEKLLQDVALLGPIHIACLPVNGIDFERRKRGVVGNMGVQDAAFFAAQAGADLTIPMHYDMVAGNGENPLVFLEYMRKTYPDKKTQIACLGEGMIYG